MKERRPEITFHFRNPIGESIFSGNLSCLFPAGGPLPASVLKGGDQTPGLKEKTPGFIAVFQDCPIKEIPFPAAKVDKSLVHLVFPVPSNLTRTRETGQMDPESRKEIRDAVETCPAPVHPVDHVVIHGVSKKFEPPDLSEKIGAPHGGLLGHDDVDLVKEIRDVKINCKDPLGYSVLSINLYLVSIDEMGLGVFPESLRKFSESSGKKHIVGVDPHHVFSSGMGRADVDGVALAPVGAGMPVGKAVLIPQEDFQAAVGGPPIDDDVLHVLIILIVNGEDGSFEE